ncbi:hypothetical protein ADILRU_2027 [Leifsonia rubra CMS 76R]|nr:hypothetical protein ADILRU_2027 [Leifsonia rubra CMS 76R]
MSTSTRLDIDLAFSLAQPISETPETPGSPETSDAASVESEQMTGTITASGLDIEVNSSKPELFVQSGTTKLKDLRVIAAALAERGLTVSLSGPNGVIVRLGAVKASVTQRLLTGSAHIALGSRNAVMPLLRRRSSRTNAAPAMLLPPGTLWPPVPTFDRSIRRRITTTHYEFGAGRPRLIFVIGSENWNGQMPREFDLLPGTTTIGSSPSADLQLPGLEPFHAEIRHDADDEYFLYSLGEVAGGSQPVSEKQAGKRVLRTGARIEMGQWRLGYFREEYADHGRPHGGRRGGELAHQKRQPNRLSEKKPKAVRPQEKPPE